MDAGYIVALFRPSDNVPTGIALHAAGGRYIYYPFKHDGPIFTIDQTLWRSVARNSSAVSQATLFNVPEADFIEAELENAKRTSSSIYVCSSEAAYWTPPGSSDVLQLVRFDSVIDSVEFPVRFLGFDALDISGISCLTNVGYAAAEVERIADAGIDPNQFGLINSRDQAIEFSRVASLLAPEHAPFLPIGVWEYSGRG